MIRVLISVVLVCEDDAKTHVESGGVNDFGIGNMPCLRAVL